VDRETSPGRFGTVVRTVSDSISFDLLWICRTACRTACCTTDPQQIESQQQVHNRSPQQVACNNQQVLQQVAELAVEQILSQSK